MAHQPHSHLISVPALQLIALFSMGIPAFIALVQLSLNSTWTTRTTAEPRY